MRLVSTRPSPPNEPVQKVAHLGDVMVKNSKLSADCATRREESESTVSRYLRSTELLIVFLFSASLVLAAQQRATPDRDFLPAGPFYFEPDAVHPTYMDAFVDRPVVKSLDGKFGVTVTGPRESYGAWVTISPSKFPDGPVQVWPIQASVDVLWRPDSQAFALTDNRYANSSYVLVCGTEFRMGEDGPGLGVPITDLTPVVLKPFTEEVQKYYKSDNYETLLFYAKVLRWIGNDKLLVGIDARTSGPGPFPDRLREWVFAYVVDVENGRVARQVSKDQLRTEYKIKVDVE